MKMYLKRCKNHLQPYESNLFMTVDLPLLLRLHVNSSSMVERSKFFLHDIWMGQLLVRREIFYRLPSSTKL